MMTMKIMMMGMIKLMIQARPNLPSKNPLIRNTGCQFAKLFATEHSSEILHESDRWKDIFFRDWTVAVWKQRQIDLSRFQKNV